MANGLKRLVEATGAGAKVETIGGASLPTLTQPGPDALTQPAEAEKPKRLTTLGVKALTAPGRHRDGEVPGLYLVVSKAGSKTWSFMYKLHGRQREAGLGNFRDVPIKAARDLAAQGRAMLKERPPRDPLAVWQADKRKQRVPTFSEAAEVYLDKKSVEWRSERHKKKLRSLVERLTKPIAHLPVDEVATADMEALLGPIMKAKPDTAMRLRGHIEAVLNAAKARGHITREMPNPAVWKGHLDQLVAKPKTKPRHFPAVQYDRLPEFLRSLRDRRRNDDGSISVGVFALEYLILTGTRSTETLGACWNEIDLAADGGPVWVISEERMKKSDRPHRVPLSDVAVAIVEEMAKIRVAGCPYVFPGYSRATPVAGKTFERLLARMNARDRKGERATAHGFRSSFRDWMRVKTATPFEVGEAALAHKVGDGTVKAYARDDLLEPRRPLMDLWAQYLSTPPAGAADNVVPFKAEA
jgi:integrase